MWLPRPRALLLGVGLLAGALLASAESAWAKPRKPKFKVHVAFTGSTDEAVAFADPPKPRRRDALPSVYTASIDDVPVWVVSARTDAKSAYQTVSISIAQTDLASATFPLEVQALHATYGTGTTGSSPQVTGFWGTGSGGGVTVTLTSYDKRRRRLSGTFTGTMKDAATFLVLPDLVVAEGSFGVVLPKPPRL